MTTLAAVTGSQRRALALTGVARSTWHYRAKPRPAVTDPVPHTDRAYPTRIEASDRARIGAYIQAGWRHGHSVDHAYAQAWDEGVMLGSRRSWWRIAARLPDQSTRPVIPVHNGAKTPREKPVLVATAPGQVWSWDITDLRTPWRGISFKGYSVIDVYSRKMVARRCEERESEHLAVEMFQHAIGEHGAPTFVHADSGPAMRSSLLKDKLREHGITMTHNRPYVSNDNPYSESEFRTMKYRPNYPGTFDTLHDARAYLDWYVPWYNEHHRHSGIALFTPNQVHDGSWQQAWQTRDRALQDYYQAHPERFRSRPRTPKPAATVGINNKPTTTPK